MGCHSQYSSPRRISFRRLHPSLFTVIFVSEVLSFIYAEFGLYISFKIYKHRAELFLLVSNLSWPKYMVK